MTSFVITGVKNYLPHNSSGTVVNMFTDAPRAFEHEHEAKRYAQLSQFRDYAVERQDDNASSQ